MIMVGKKKLRWLLYCTAPTSYDVTVIGGEDNYTDSYCAWKSILPRDTKLPTHVESMLFCPLQTDKTLLRDAFGRSVHLHRPALTIKLIAPP